MKPGIKFMTLIILAYVCGMVSMYLGAPWWFGGAVGGVFGGSTHALINWVNA